MSQQGGGGSDQIPTSLTDLGTGGDSQFYCDYQEQKSVKGVPSGWGEGPLLRIAAQGYFFNKPSLSEAIIESSVMALLTLFSLSRHFLTLLMKPLLSDSTGRS